MGGEAPGGLWRDFDGSDRRTSILNERGSDVADKIKALSLFMGLAVLLTAGRCASIKYEDDIGFLNSAQANSMEYMVKVKGLVCRDLEGEIGACTVRVDSDQVIRFEQDPRPYAYRLAVRCTEGTGVDFSVDVEPNKDWSFEIEPKDFAEFRSFSCQGEVFPHDRDNSLSALWQVRLLVVDKDYRPRERIYHREGHLVLGKHAKYARICQENRCKNYSKKPIIEAKKGSSAWSESELMRINYYNY